MDALLGLLNQESLMISLSEAAKADLTQKLIVFYVMWRVVKKTIAEHFKNVENGLEKVALKVEDIGNKMASIEQAHATRIGALEIRVTKVEQGERHDQAV